MMEPKYGGKTTEVEIAYPVLSRRKIIKKRINKVEKSSQFIANDELM